jgi:hypothetical protein
MLGMRGILVREKFFSSFGLGLACLAHALGSAHPHGLIMLRHSMMLQLSRS